ncbi:MAG: ExbD/TolR family protein [Syntrophobacteraceae bacterium]
MARKKRSSYDAIADINITPFTDVVLVLLIIFMIATPILMIEGLRINLPAEKKQVSAAEKEDVFVSISISAEGAVFVDGQERPLSELKPILQQMAELDPNSIVAIGAHPDTLYESVVRVVDIARAAGVARYVLVK